MGVLGPVRVMTSFWSALSICSSAFHGSSPRRFELKQAIGRSGRLVNNLQHARPRRYRLEQNQSRCAKVSCRDTFGLSDAPRPLTIQSRNVRWAMPVARDLGRSFGPFALLGSPRRYDAHAPDERRVLAPGTNRDSS